MTITTLIIDAFLLAALPFVLCAIAQLMRAWSRAGAWTTSYSASRFAVTEASQTEPLDHTERGSVAAVSPGASSVRAARVA
jgi:hypothetical protein